MVVLLYVDDMIITGNDEKEVAKLQDELAIRFNIKNLGELYHFLGLEVINMKNGIFMTQESYALKLVERFGLNHSKKCSTPLDVYIKLRREEGSLLSNPQPYRALIGSLLYLTITRPDIAFVVGYVNMFMQSPRKPHLEVVKKILKYVNSTPDLDLYFRMKAGISLTGFTYTDFGGDLDDRRSISGYVFLCGDTSVSWSNKKQSSASLSTTEYKVAAFTIQECLVTKTCSRSIYSYTRANNNFW